MKTRTLVACLLLDPFALWLAGRRHPGLPVAVVDGGRVCHANDLAREGGVLPGMAVHGALSRVPELAALPLAEPLVKAEWEALVEGLLAFSPRVEALGTGRVLLTLTEGAARELATQYAGRVGLAASREIALLAAASARPGEVRLVPADEQDAALAALPLDTLAQAGLSDRKLADLRFLGLRCVGDLLRWSRAQQAGFLGAEYAALKPFLHGPRSDRVASRAPVPDLTAALDFESPVHEPGELGPALADLAREVAASLGTRTARRLVLTAVTVAGRLDAAREAKEHLGHEGAARRLAEHALRDLGREAFELGIERLELRLAGLHTPARQVGLWTSVRELDATRRVLERFPNALVRAEWFSGRRYAFDQRFRWVDLVTGEPRPSNVAPPVPRVASARRPATPKTDDALGGLFPAVARWADDGSS